MLLLFILFSRNSLFVSPQMVSIVDYRIFVPMSQRIIVSIDEGWSKDRIGYRFFLIAVRGA